MLNVPQVVWNTETQSPVVYLGAGENGYILCSLRGVTELKNNNKIIEHFVKMTGGERELGTPFSGTPILFENGSAGYFDTLLFTDDLFDICQREIIAIRGLMDNGTICPSSEAIGKIKRPLKIFTGESEVKVNINILGLSIYVSLSKEHWRNSFQHRLSFQSRKYPFNSHSFLHIRIERANNLSTVINNRTGEKINGRWTIIFSILGFSILNKYEFTKLKLFGAKNE